MKEATKRIENQVQPVLEQFTQAEKKYGTDEPIFRAGVEMLKMDVWNLCGGLEREEQKKLGDWK